MRGHDGTVLERTGPSVRTLATGGPGGNSRLTALTACVLLVLLAAEGATLLSLRSFVSWHIAIGMLLVPVVALKLASTGYRFVRYYAGAQAYVREGPPPAPLRLLGPVVVLSTVGRFATGVTRALLGPGTAYVLLLHKASFVVWLGALSLHVLGHLFHLPGLTRPDLGRGDGLPGSRLRLGLVAGAIVAGALIAVASWSLAAPWVHTFGA
jgi:hypothetical protein